MILTILIFAALVVVSRKYNSADVDMINACDAILGQVRPRKAAFLAQRPRYTDQFLDEFAEMILRALEICGGNNVKELKRATKKVKELKREALNNLGDFKTFLESDFKENMDRCREILSELGLSSSLKEARNSQAALLETLFSFRQGMTADIRAEVEAAGMAPLLIDVLMAAGEIFKAANTAQEVLKGGRPELTQTDIKFLNKVYNIGTALANDGQRIYKDDAAVLGAFSFSSYVTTSKKKREEEAESEEDENELPPSEPQTDGTGNETDPV